MTSQQNHLLCGHRLLNAFVVDAALLWTRKSNVSLEHGNIFSKTDNWM